MKRSRNFLSAMVLAAMTLASVGTVTGQTPLQRIDKTHEAKPKLASPRNHDRRILNIPVKRVVPSKLTKTARLAPPSEPQKIQATTTAEVPAIYGSCVFQNTWTESSYPIGLYKLPQSSTGSAELLFTGPDATNGGVLLNDVYTATVCNEVYGLRFTYVKQYDINDGREIKSMEGDNDNVSVGIAADPTTGDIYGIFYNDQFSALQFGKIDYSNRPTTTPISTLEGVWCAFAIDGHGQCYGIRQNLELQGEEYVCTASYLFKIDKNSGEPTLIGATGQMPQYPSGACFDIRTNRLFWNVCPPDGSSLLCEINTTTGLATTLYSLADDGEYVGMYIPWPAAEDKAPAALEDVNIRFNGASIEAMVSFTTPATFYDGTPGSGDMTIHVETAGIEVGSMTAAYGKACEMEIRVPEAGIYDFQLYASNEVGNGPRTKINNVFVGKDTPAATTATLSYSDGTMHLSWLPVTESLNGGYINTDNITYTVTRYPEGVVVADQIHGTVFTEDIPEPENICTYYYTVTVNCEGLTSAPASSNTVALGSVNPPYRFDFATQGLDGWTVIDANNNELEWEVEREGHAAIRYDDIPMDDWLITPGIKMQAGKAYEISFDAWARSIYYPERFEVKFGKSNSPSEMTEVLLSPTETNSVDPIRYTVTIVPDEDGVYFVGFHAISDADSFYFYINNVSVSASIYASAPSAPENLVIIPDPSGKLKTEISFTAPTTTIGGLSLEEITKIEVLRGETIVKTFTNPAPGETLTCVDILPKAGDITYSVVATNANGRGQSASTTVYVGVNLAAAPDVVRIMTTGTEGEVTVSWDAVTSDINGNTISPADVKYNLYDYSNKQLEPIELGISGTSYTYQAVEGTDQKFIQVAVYPVTDAGMMWGTLSRMIPAGQAYADIQETFPDCQTSYIWNVESDMEGVWAICNDNVLPGVTSQDGDNGFIAFEAKSADETSFLASGLVSLKGMENPGISFYVFNMVSPGIYDENEIEVAVRKTDEADFSTLYSSSIVDACGKDKRGWGKISVPLTEYAGATVQVKITIITRIYTHTAIDNITVGSLRAHDLSIFSTAAPQQVSTGSEFGIDVTVSNEGMRTAEAYKVVLYANGFELLEEVYGPLEAGSRRVVNFNCLLSPFAQEAVTLFAEVVYPEDEDGLNNTGKTFEIAPIESLLPPVTGLKAIDGGNSVDLQWTAPDLSLAPLATTTNDFEDGDAFTDSYGDFIFVDGDQSPVAGFQGMTVPGITEGETTASFRVWDTNFVGTGNSFFDAHSGSKYLFSLYRADNGQVDDWMITPALEGCAQTVTFYAKSFSEEYPELIEFYYSTGSTDTADFVKLSDKAVYVPEQWTLYRAELPEGATRLAIRSCATSSFMLMIDDLTYVAEGADVAADLIRYDIYRDYELIGTVTDCNYADATAEAGMEYDYAVVAVYTTGMAVPAEVSGQSALGNRLANGARIATGPGKIIIEGADGLVVNVANAAGITFFNATAANTEFISVPAGIYLVSIDGVVTKVIVR